MGSYKRFLLVFIFTLLFFVLLLSQIHLLVGGFIAKQAETESDYLESLRNNTEFGCMTALAREPELFLIGNSGSYATWDMQQLESMTGLRVGGCMMGGATIETFELILDLAGYIYRPPKYFIIGSSIYTFLKRESHAEQLLYQKNLLRKAHFPYEFLISRALKKINNINVYPALFNEQEKLISINRYPLEANNDFIEQLLRTQPLPDLDNAKKLNVTQRYGDFGRSTITRMCSKVKSMGAKLWVINIPTSPEAEAVYTADLWNYYVTALRGFEDCAEKVIPFRGSKYALKNRHYVNRMLNKYPYDDWREGKSIDLLYDIDHPNPFGAEVFTKLAIYQIFGSGKYLNINIE